MSQTDNIEIPLFPLPNVVLFPSVMLPLHIFEERYKNMINECVDADSPFGVVWCSGEEENATTVQQSGALARVAQIERLDEGRMNIYAEGEARFRIVRFLAQGPNWRAEVKPFDDSAEPGTRLSPLSHELGDLYQEAYRKGLSLTGERPGKLDLPDTPADLSFMVAYVLDMDFEEKQRLLEMTSTQERLTVLIEYLKHANERLEQQIHQKRIAETARGNGDLGKPSGV